LVAIGTEGKCWFVWWGSDNGGLIFPDFVYGRDAALSTAKIVEIIGLTKNRSPS
jgi:phosphomannomutase